MGSSFRMSVVLGGNVDHKSEQQFLIGKGTSNLWYTWIQSCFFWGGGDNFHTLIQYNNLFDIKIIIFLSAILVSSDILSLGLHMFITQNN